MSCVDGGAEPLSRSARRNGLSPGAEVNEPGCVPLANGLSEDADDGLCCVRSRSALANGLSSCDWVADPAEPGIATDVVGTLPAPIAPAVAPPGAATVPGDTETGGG